jgi:hypothetical protein
LRFGHTDTYEILRAKVIIRVKFIVRFRTFACPRPCLVAFTHLFDYYRILEINEHANLDFESFNLEIFFSYAQRSIVKVHR